MRVAVLLLVVVRIPAYSEQVGNDCLPAGSGDWVHRHVERDYPSSIPDKLHSLRYRLDAGSGHDYVGRERAGRPETARVPVATGAVYVVVGLLSWGADSCFLEAEFIS